MRAELEQELIERRTVLAEKLKAMENVSAACSAADICCCYLLLPTTTAATAKLHPYDVWFHYHGLTTRHSALLQNKKVHDAVMATLLKKKRENALVAQALWDSVSSAHRDLLDTDEPIAAEGSRKRSNETPKLAKLVSEVIDSNRLMKNKQQHPHPHPHLHSQPQHQHHAHPHR